MKLHEVCDIVNGTIQYDSETEHDYTKAFASDLMSDVLRFSMENTVLITGLSVVQTIRTAEISGVTCIVIARDKKVTKEMLDLASECNISIITSKLSLYEISGVLYMHGLKPIY